MCTQALLDTLVFFMLPPPPAPPAPAVSGPSVKPPPKPQRREIEPAINLNGLDLQALGRGLLVALDRCATASTPGADKDAQARIASPAALLLGGILLARPELLEGVLYQWAETKAFLERTLLLARDSSVRDHVRVLLVALSKLPAVATKDPRVFLLGHLLWFLDTVSPTADTCREYFSLLAHLVASTPVALLPTPLPTLYTRLVSLLHSHPLVEIEAPGEVFDPTQEDISLQGVLHLLGTVVEAQPSVVSEGGVALLEEIFRRVLFDTPTPERHGLKAAPLAKLSPTRQYALALLARLCKASDAASAHLRKLVYTHQLPDYNGPLQWELSPASETRAHPAGYVGLTNMGCTCYMNSLMQQFYMMPAFRRAMLGVPSALVESPPGLKKAPESRAKNLLLQMQTMFAFLHESDRQVRNNEEKGRRRVGKERDQGNERRKGEKEDRPEETEGNIGVKELYLGTDSSLLGNSSC